MSACCLGCQPFTTHQATSAGCGGLERCSGLLQNPLLDALAVFASADITVLAGYREGLPKSLIEAAACGLPGGGHA